LLRLLRVEERQQRAYERQDQEWESMPQSEGPETGVEKQRVQKRFALRRPGGMVSPGKLGYLRHYCAWNHVNYYGR
jgi:hypothetical protein